MSQEWSNLLADSLKSPVVNVCEIAVHYRFGLRQMMTMLSCALIAALMIFVSFHYNDSILAFLSREGLTQRILSSTVILLVVPTFAFLYSNVTRLLLKLVKLD